jgi:hypothetical protein
LAAQWTEYRKAMIEHAGIAIFVFGNKRDSSGVVIPSNGMREEFDLCVQAGVRPIPVGATGFMAEELWKEVTGNLPKYFPGASANFQADFQKLGDPSTGPSELLQILQRLIEQIQRG